MGGVRILHIHSFFRKSLYIMYILIRAHPPDVTRGVQIVAIATRSVGAQNGGPDSGSSLDGHRQLS